MYLYKLAFDISMQALYKQHTIMVDYCFKDRTIVHFILKNLTIYCYTGRVFEFFLSDENRQFIKIPLVIT